MPQRKRKRKLNLYRLGLLILAFLFIIGGIIALVLLITSIKDMPSWNIDSLTANAATLVYDKDNNLVTKIGAEYHEPVSINNIPDTVKNAFLAVEDVRFYQHQGIDLKAIARALYTDLTGGSIQQGASTITQQLAKVSFLTPERTLKRKIQEAILAFKLEHSYSKDEILEMYFNKIYFGEGAWGIQSAAQTYFGKKINELDLSEAATLAGLPKAPTLYSPYQIQYNEKLKAGDPELYKTLMETYYQEGQPVNLQSLIRRNTVLDNMYKYDFITKEQLVEAKAEPIKVLKNGPVGQQYPYPYFIDFITDQLIDHYGEAEVFKGGLEVYTTLDPKIQKIVEEVVANPNNFPKSTHDKNGVIQPETAVVVLDPYTGYIKAMVGGREHTQKRVLNRAVRPRQPGSAFKPIADYGPAIELLGKGPASIVDDIPPKSGWPKNYDGRFHGLVTYRTALAQSYNISAVNVLKLVGISNSINFVKRLGINLNPSVHGLSMGLGGLNEGVTPLQMASAYGAFANQGIYTKSTAILRVEKNDGTILEEITPKPQRVMKSTTAYLITNMLQSVIENGTGRRAQLGRPAAGKTGTTDYYKDIWFAGYTPELVGIVWIGYDLPKSMPQSFGGTYPAQIWQQIMSRIFRDQPVHNFPRPEGIVTVTVDSKSGLLPGPNTPPEHLVTDIFAAGTVPTDFDNTHVPVEICATTGQLANAYCPDRIVRVLIKLPYSVPETVADYFERVPGKVCTLHGPGVSDYTYQLPNELPPEINLSPGEE